jgi:hypothetical protein
LLNKANVKSNLLLNVFPKLIMQGALSSMPASSWCNAWVQGYRAFYPEVGGIVVFRNIGKLPSDQRDNIK